MARINDAMRGGEVGQMAQMMKDLDQIIRGVAGMVKEKQAQADKMEDMNAEQQMRVAGLQLDGEEAKARLVIEGEKAKREMQMKKEAHDQEMELKRREAEQKMRLAEREKSNGGQR